MPRGDIADAVVALDRLPADEQTGAVSRLSPHDAADLVEHIVSASAVEIIDNLPVKVAASILDEVASDCRADLISGLSNETAEAIIVQMQPVEAEDTRALLKYASDTAGGLMITEFVSFSVDQDVGDVIDDFSQNADRYRDYDVQYSFVCEAERLVGVLSPPRFAAQSAFGAIARDHDFQSSLDR